jgi:hypothetical protein
LPRPGSAPQPDAKRLDCGTGHILGGLRPDLRVAAAMPRAGAAP